MITLSPPDGPDWNAGMRFKTAISVNSEQLILAAQRALNAEELESIMTNLNTQNERFTENFTSEMPKY
jgi:hypothetical protein